VTSIVPLVIVPVLSNTMISDLPAASREAAVLNKTPLRAPIPFPTMMATGVARPRAHGQLITSTEIPRARANPNDAPHKSQTIIVIAAIVSTAGTKMPDTLSATFAIGALVAAASDTRRIICASVVSSPTRFASQRIKPVWFSVAEDTASPGSLSTGRLSPEMADSSTAQEPSRITPSTGTDSPGRTRKMSPGFTSDMATVISFPSFTSVAVCGARFIRPFSASVVRPFEIASRNFPTVIKVRIMAADSK